MTRDTRSPWRRQLGKPTFFFSVVAAVVALDLGSKQLALQALPPGQPVPVVGEYFSLFFIQNPGVAFGISLGSHGQWLMVALSLLALLALAALYRQTGPADRRRLLAMALVWGGALGNLVDRLRSARGVVDFLVFQYRDWQSPVFNVADIAITSGAILLALALWRDEPRVPAPVRERRGGGAAGSPGQPAL